MFMGEKFGRDSIWETHLGNELLQTDMKMNAVLDEVTVPLSEIMNWKPGSRLMLNVKADDLVSLRAGEVTLFQGRMGSLNNHIAVKVEKASLQTIKRNERVARQPLRPADRHRRLAPARFRRRIRCQQNMLARYHVDAAQVRRLLLVAKSVERQ